ncbi:TPA: plasmid replication initiator TrfA [Pseudomonas aeruginosa]|nr:hypothetical protein [Pseudomonas aeruginosa]EIU2864193.1 hypothetical protein [Pseudomonas aeruginosa]MBH4415199.1 hypothetical protein [Pseudomonas aeruginosa]HEJ2342298.1 hypothetical protein [Pseudomonas aeruginosa]HEK3717341.1 hypothetical protein [Pseudomonas aeruginosa]
MKEEQNAGGLQQGLDLESVVSTVKEATSATPRKGSGMARVKARSQAVVEQQSKKLNGWAEEIREAPNEILRSALFTVGNKNRPRRHIKNEDIAVYGNCRIQYNGEELRQDDFDLWLEILHLARNVDLDQRIYFNVLDMKKELGYPYGAKHTERLKTNLLRLKTTSVIVHSDRLGRGVSLSLVRKFEYSDEEGASRDDEWYVELEPEMTILFGGGVYSTRIEKEQRMKLKGNLAKWLHAFYGSHKAPFDISYKTLLTAAGSDVASEGKKRQMIKGALDELKECGFLKNWKLDKAGNVQVERTRYTAITKD